MMNFSNIGSLTDFVLSLDVRGHLFLSQLNCSRSTLLIIVFLSRVHATLQPALSVHPSVTLRDVEAVDFSAASTASASASASIL